MPDKPPVDLDRVVPVGHHWVWRIDRTYRSATPAERAHARCKTQTAPGQACRRRAVAALNNGTARRPAWTPVCDRCLGPNRRLMDAVVVRRVLAGDH